VLPFLLLPVPTTAPFFLLHFLISLVLHARPCVYCVAFLISLFLSSYYWAPVPASELSLAVATLEGYEYNGKPVLSYLPPMIQLLDRSWVDYSYGGFFQPFNVTQWEIDSVRHTIAKVIRAEKKAEELLAKAELDRANRAKEAEENSADSLQRMDDKPLSTGKLYVKTYEAFQRSWFSFLEILLFPKYAVQYGRHVLNNTTSPVIPSHKRYVEVKRIKKARNPRVIEEAKPLWFGLKTHYDLNPYGLDCVVRLWPVD